MGETTIGTSMSDFSSNINYVPFTRDSDDKQSCQVGELAFSKLDEQYHTIRPGYGIITYEIINKNIYNKVANPPTTDKNGIHHHPLSLKQYKEIIDKGTLYNPAGNHYGKEVITVICDRCREIANVCIGYDQNNDLCMPCVTKIKEEWNKIHGQY